MEIPVTSVQKPKTHSVDPKTLKDDSRNPANIPSLRKQYTSKPHRKLKVKRMPDVQPALEQLFEDGETQTQQIPVPPPPQEIYASEALMKQVMRELEKSPQRISDAI